MLYIISALVFVLYTTTILMAFGVLPSVSDSYYALKKHNMSAQFTIFCWGSAFPLLIYWIDLLPNDWDFLPFIACGGLLLVGTAPAFKDVKLEKKVHSTAAIVCAISSYIWTILYASLFLSINFILLSILLYFLLKKNKTYWIEMLAFINIYIQILL